MYVLTAGSLAAQAANSYLASKQKSPTSSMEVEAFKHGSKTTRSTKGASFSAAAAAAPGTSSLTSHFPMSLFQRHHHHQAHSAAAAAAANSDCNDEDDSSSCSSTGTLSVDGNSSDSEEPDTVRRSSSKRSKTSSQGKKIRSCLVIPGRPKSNRRGDVYQMVRFHKCSVREYAREVGDNPSVRGGGPPLTLGWKWMHARDYLVEDYEKQRLPVRCKSKNEYRVPAIAREILLLEFGVTLHELQAATDQATVDQKRRIQTRKQCLAKSKAADVLVTASRQIRRVTTTLRVRPRPSAADEKSIGSITNMISTSMRLVTSHEDNNNHNSHTPSRNSCPPAVLQEMSDSLTTEDPVAVAMEQRQRKQFRAEERARVRQRAIAAAAARASEAVDVSRIASLNLNDVPTDSDSNTTTETTTTTTPTADHSVGMRKVCSMTALDSFHAKKPDPFLLLIDDVMSHDEEDDSLDNFEEEDEEEEDSVREVYSATGAESLVEELPYDEQYAARRTSEEFPLSF